MRQLGAQHGGLDLVQTRIDARQVVPVLHAAAVVAQLAQRGGQFVVIGGDGAAVAQRAEVLAGVEAEARRVAQAAGAPAHITRAMGLGRVFDHAQTVAARDGVDRAHVGRLAVQVHRHDGAGAWRDGRLDAARIEVVGLRVALHRHWRGAGLADRQPGSDEGRRRHDDLAAGADAPGAQHQVQGVQAIGHGNTVRGAAVLRELALESLVLGALQVPARGQHTVDAGADGRVVRRVDAAQVQELDHRAHLARMKSA